jgi:uncharacterized glyoxalase superfamily protein PhnB
MTDATPRDPFDTLRRPDAPIAPDAAFAARLRARLTAELRPLLPAAPQSSATSTGTGTGTTSGARTASSSPSNRRSTSMTVTPYLIAHDAAAAIDFYRDAFGAVELHRLIGDDGRIGHAEIMIGDSTLMLADEYPEIDAVGPQTRGGPTCSFSIDVDDVDAAYERALAFGAESRREPADQFHGSRSATVQDPSGHRWTLTRLIEQLSTEEYAERAANAGPGSYTLQPGASEPGSPAAAGSAAAAGETTSPHPQAKPLDRGDLYYFTLPVSDLARAKRFFGGVLGWQFGDAEQGHIENISAPPGGLNDKTTDSGVRLWFVVDDIHSAVARVRELGGRADDPVYYDSGWSADCTDDQGTVFSLSVPSPEYSV